jgi:hypothetical protein
MLQKSVLIEKSIIDPPKLMFARIFWKHFHGKSIIYMVIYMIKYGQMTKLNLSKGEVYIKLYMS